ncbi:MAG TPA: zinc ribbon domain-containing protein, partial [Sedimentibacter sp.]|nr:zinc ribbon domain-containing protein [Sedimentibacter sp.]
MNKVKYCRKCGNAISDGVKFCRHCGALQYNQSKSPSISDSQPSKKNTKGPDVIDNSIKQKQKEKYFNNNETKTVKKKRGIFGKIAALLLIIFIAVNIINFLSNKPNEPGSILTTTGNDENKSISEYVLSDVKISDDDLNIPAQSGFVSPDEPEITIENTFINFSSYNLEGTKEVKVKRLNQISDSEKGYTIQAYDFEIEGISEFNVPVYIEMPYYPVIEDNLYEESTIFVQYYNENESKWEMIPSWINAEANTVAILTNHFSPFGVFQDDNLEDAKKIAHLFQYYGKYKGPTTPVYTTGTNIQRYYQFVDEKTFQTYIDYKTVPVNDFATSFLNVMNHGASAGEYSLYALSPEIYKDTISGFSNAGKLFVFSKIAYQWYNGVATSDIIISNIFDLTEIAISGAGTLLAAPELTVIAGGVWLTGLTYDVGTTAYEYMSENEPRYLAYRLASESGYIKYLPDEEIC